MSARFMEKYRHMKIKVLLITMSLVLCMSACRKSTSCYDAALAHEFEVKDCSMQYAPVVGCDGQTYPSECVANTYGIRVR